MAFHVKIQNEKLLLVSVIHTNGSSSSKYNSFQAGLTRKTGPTVSPRPWSR